MNNEKCTYTRIYYSYAPGNNPEVIIQVSSGRRALLTSSPRVDEAESVGYDF